MDPDSAEWKWSLFPKVELHLHLDTSVSYQVASALEPGLTRERYDEEFVAPPLVGSLTAFLQRAWRQVALLQTEEALRLLATDVVEQLAADGVAYAELRFAPLLHLERGLTPERVVDAVVHAAMAAGQANDVALGFILCTLRHFDAEQSMATAVLVEEFAAKGFTVGFDLAGDEINHPLEAHLAAFAHIRERDLPFTVHAGEAGGPENVTEVLDALSPTRIGHGVRCVEDATVLARVAAERVHLEVCPSCNVQTEVAPSYADHQLTGLRTAGVELGISTDQRTITPITLSREYARLEHHLGWTKADFLRANLSALAVSFASDEMKQAISDRLTAAYAD